MPKQKSRFGTRVRRLFVGFCAAVGLIVLAVTFTPIVPWWSTRLAGDWNQPKGDTLIVLSGSSSSDNILGYSTYLRCQYAILAWRTGGIRRIVVTGTPANDMKAFISAEGVPTAAIETETQSTSTRESALNTRQLVREGERNILLTSDYHMYRALRAFRKVGIEVISSPFPDAIKRATSWSRRWDAFLDLVTETLKILYYRTRGWI